jgi:hypothetical protein
MDAILATIVPGRLALIQLNIEVDKYILINLLNLTKPFNSSLRQYMRKAAHPSGGMDSLNPHCWRDKRLHHHGDGVCKVICAFCADFFTLRG